jgi:hypothetical protein
MAWIDRLMDRITARGPKLVGSGHAPADTTPPTGSGELSEELEADYGQDSLAAEPPEPEHDAGPGEPDRPSP